MKRGAQLIFWCIKLSGFKKTIIIFGYNSVGQEIRQGSSKKFLHATLSEAISSLNLFGGWAGMQDASRLHLQVQHLYFPSYSLSLSPLGYAGHPTSTVVSGNCSCTQQVPSKGQHSQE